MDQYIKRCSDLTYGKNFLCDFVLFFKKNVLFSHSNPGIGGTYIAMNEEQNIILTFS
jgi:hypothetical protein